MAKWIMAALAGVMFCMAIVEHLREGALVSAERQRMAASNAARQQRSTGGPVWIEIEPDRGKLLADAFLRGEVWFLLTPLAWAVLGGVALAGAGIAVGVSRRRRKKQT